MRCTPALGLATSLSLVELWSTASVHYTAWCPVAVSLQTAPVEDVTSGAEFLEPLAEAAARAPPAIVCGIPDVLYTDHGSDFTLRDLEQVGASAGTDGFLDDLLLNLGLLQISRPRQTLELLQHAKRDLGCLLLFAAKKWA